MPQPARRRWLFAVAGFAAASRLAAQPRARSARSRAAIALALPRPLLVRADRVIGS